MDYPKRVEQHVMESESFRIFQTSVPRHWLVRELTERDYGIDCYIEMVNLNGEMTGQLALFQLKAVSKLNWSQSSSASIIKTTNAPVMKISTLNYCYGFPTPVFLAVIDIACEKVYFANIKDQMRNRLYLSQKEASLTLSESDQFDEDRGTISFVRSYFHERNREAFERQARELLINWERYLEVIDWNCGRDFFLEVQREAEIAMQHIFAVTEFMAHYLDIAWTQKSLHEHYEKDKVDFRHSGGCLHESTMTAIMTTLRPAFIEVVRRVLEVVVMQERDYWLDTNHALFTFCDNLHFDERLSQHAIQ